MPDGLWNVICLGTKRLKIAIDDEFSVLRRVLAMYREEAGVPDAPTGDTRTWRISSVIGLGLPRREGSVNGYFFVELGMSNGGEFGNDDCGLGGGCVVAPCLGMQMFVGWKSV